VTDPGCFSSDLSYASGRGVDWRSLCRYWLPRKPSASWKRPVRGVPQLQGIRESAASGSVCGGAIYPCVCAFSCPGVRRSQPQLPAWISERVRNEMPMRARMSFFRMRGTGRMSAFIAFGIRRRLLVTSLSLLLIGVAVFKLLPPGAKPLRYLRSSISLLKGFCQHLRQVADTSRRGVRCCSF
jgi:hypothetical protein